MLPAEIESLRTLLEKEILRLGAELVELGYRRMGSKGVLTAIVDKDGGITLEDCVRVNNHLSTFLDELSQNPESGSGQALLSNPYYLEVNSPGLDRPLRTEKELARQVGKTLRIVMKSQTKGGAVTYVGELLAVSEGSVELRVLATRSIIKLRIEDMSKTTREVSFGRLR